MSASGFKPSTLAKCSSRTLSRSSSRLKDVSGSPPGSAIEADGPEPLPPPPRPDEREAALPRDDRFSALANLSRDLSTSNLKRRTSSSDVSSSEDSGLLSISSTWQPEGAPDAITTALASPCRGRFTSGSGTRDDPALVKLWSGIGSGLQPVG